MPFLHFSRSLVRSRALYLLAIGAPIVASVACTSPPLADDFAEDELNAVAEAARACAAGPLAGTTLPGVQLMTAWNERGASYVTYMRRADEKVSVLGRQFDVVREDVSSGTLRFATQGSSAILMTRTARGIYDLRAFDTSGAPPSSRPTLTSPSTTLRHAKVGDAVHIPVSSRAASTASRGTPAPAVTIEGYYLGDASTAPAFHEGAPPGLSLVEKSTATRSDGRDYALTGMLAGLRAGNILHVQLRGGGVTLLLGIDLLPRPPVLAPVGRVNVAAERPSVVRLASSDVGVSHYGIDGLPFATEAREDGAVRIAPRPSDVGIHCAKAWVEHDGAYAEEAFVLDVRRNVGGAPIIARSDSREQLVLAGRNLRVVLEASDPDGDPLRVMVERGPGTVSESAGGKYELAFQAKDDLPGGVDWNPLPRQDATTIVAASDGLHTSRLVVPITVIRDGQNVAGTWSVALGAPGGGPMNALCINCNAFQLSAPDATGRGVVRALRDDGTRVANAAEIGFVVTPHEARDGSAWLTFDGPPHAGALGDCRKLRVTRVREAVLVLDRAGHVRAVFRSLDRKDARYGVLAGPGGYAQWVDGEAGRPHYRPWGGDACFEGF